MTARIDITPESLRQLFEYNPDTGHFTWRRIDYGVAGFSDHYVRIHNAYRYGKAAFLSPDKHGYLGCILKERRFAAHRAAWAIVHNELPPVVDHLNGDPSDNRIVNLRGTTQASNSRNCKLRASNKSGVPGVTSIGKKWRATIGFGGVKKSLGCFDDYEAAVAARKKAEFMYGYGPNSGASSPQE
jgi:hypothetical protein